MKVYKFFPVLLAAAVWASCGQPTNTTANSDTVKTDTIIKTDTVLAADTPGADHVPLARLIVPGISIGQTTLNENADNIYKRMGKPDAGDAAMGKSLATWYAKHDTSGYQTQIFFSRQMGVDETSRVKQIRVTSPWFKTATGLHVGTPFKDLSAFFKLNKVATYQEKAVKYSVYDDERTGIAFEINNRDLCSGIIVHQPQTKVMDTYMAFHSNAKVLQ